MSKIRITDIRLLPLVGHTPEGGWDEKMIRSGTNLHTIVEVVTDAGVTGLGSVFTSLTLIQGAINVMKPFLIGASAIDPAATSETLHQQTFWQGRGGAITHAISGIDIALWDILGKVTKQPISRLLGGRHRERIKPYGSMLMQEPAKMGAPLKAGIKRGFRAFKIGWGPFGRRDAKTDEAIVKAARNAVGDDIDGFVKLTEHAPLPISSCEVLTRRQSFIEWIERRAVDYIQPDVTKVGGLTEQHRIGQYADDHSILMVPHGWNTAVGLAADLQLVAAAGNARWVEYITPAPYVEDLFDKPLKMDKDGMLVIPDGPGLGFKWNEDGIEKHTGGMKLTKSLL